MAFRKYCFGQKRRRNGGLDLKKTILLLNLGSPATPEPQSVGEYLKEFLMDPFVLDIPRWLRWILVHILIVPRRKHRSSHAYKKVWLDRGSPLVQNTRELAEKLARTLDSGWRVEWAMRYGPHRLNGRNLENIYLLPLYPQYALSSTETAVDQARKSGATGFYLRDFFEEPEFIQAYAENIRDFMSRYPDYKLLFSYHGLPKRHLAKVSSPLSGCAVNEDWKCCDQVSEANRLCYRAQCLATTRALAEELGLKDIPVSFQSRLGSGWITPFTDKVVEEWARSGVKNIAVACPSFIADCLETLEEVQMALRASFIECGGEDLKLIPCLNSSDQWVARLRAMILRTHESWRKI